MEMCQRNVMGRVIPETWLTLPIALVIDSSGTMGEYPPANMEAAVNAFFRTLGGSKDTDDLVEVCLYESHGRVDLLSGFGRPSDFKLSDVRPGGSWGLPLAIAQALGEVADYSLLLERQGLPALAPLIIVVSGNRIDASEESLQMLDEVVASNLQGSLRGVSMACPLPRCLFIGADDGRLLRSHLPAVECRLARRETLVSCMRGIAREVIEAVRPRHALMTSARRGTQQESEGSQ